LRRIALPTIAVVAAACFIALIVFGVSQTGDDRRLDQAVAAHSLPAAPDATARLPLLTGSGTLSLAQFRGKVVVLNLWASWCPPCRDEAPQLAALQRRIAPLGATVVGVTWNDSIPDAAKFAKEAGLNYPQARDVGGPFAKAYGTKGLPETFVIDRSGRITAMRRGEIDAAFLNSATVPLLGARAAAK
jgi:cytochrome c biogenesis protein CcmG/thiol:disulfide interchange protein DsbE